MKFKKRIKISGKAYLFKCETFIDEEGECIICYLSECKTLRNKLVGIFTVTDESPSFEDAFSLLKDNPVLFIKTIAIKIVSNKENPNTDNVYDIIKKWNGIL